MKNILFILAITISSFSFGQGNLQFNQVRTETYTSPGFTADYAESTIGTLTVPAGKVLKIESASLAIRMATSYARTDNQFFSLRVDEQVLLYRGNANYNGNSLKHIVWLAEGTYNIIVSNETSTDFVAGSTATINGIEFNVVP
mgnify:CR=1 FL=1